MDIQEFKADLNKAAEHLQASHEAGSAAENITHTIWETVGGLATNSSPLYVLSPRDPSLPATNRMVTPQDITTTIDTAATGYREAYNELSEVSKGSGNSHINDALTHLHNAIELLRDGDMDATTRAKMIESNVEKLGEGVTTIVRLLLEMNDVAYRLESSARWSVRHSLKSREAIEKAQETI